MSAPVDLSGLHRYDLSADGPCFAPNDGSYVLYDDLCALLAAAPACSDPVVETNVALLRSLSAVGIEKYGTTVADNKLPLRAWLNHALEETLDNANYLQRAMQEIDAAPAPATPAASVGTAKSEDRSKWTVKQWYEHVGAWENAQGEVCFGSVMALGAMLKLMAKARHAAVAQFDIGSLKEQAEAWEAVTKVLDSEIPSWGSLSQRGIESAVMAIVSLAKAAAPQQHAQAALSDTKPDAETFALYKAVNEMMAHIGMHGHMEGDHETVDTVMNALWALDGGKVALRVEDLVEKAFMPRDQATRLAVDEYIVISEGAASQQPAAAQHVAVSEGGVLRWLTGRKIMDCELYTAAPSPVQREVKS